jgi:hypothetical protein
MRGAILASALAFIVLLGGLTLSVIAETGIGILEVVSLLILAMLGFGIVGALMHPDDE